VQGVPSEEGSGLTTLPQSRDSHRGEGLLGSQDRGAPETPNLLWWSRICLWPARALTLGGTSGGLGILPEERQSLEVSLASFQLPDSVTMIVLASGAQAERLREIMLDRGIVAPIIARKQSRPTKGRSSSPQNPLSGFRIPGLMVLTDRESLVRDPRTGDEEVQGFPPPVDAR